MAGNVTDSEQELAPIASINVTPFVDVVLVLLVIFMVTAPMIMKDSMNIRLPKTTSSDGQKMDTLGLAIAQDGSVLLNGQLVDESGVRLAARQALGTNPEVQAIIAADHRTPHGEVVKVIDWLKSSGLERFAIQIDKQQP